MKDFMYMAAVKVPDPDISQLPGVENLFNKLGSGVYGMGFVVGSLAGVIALAFAGGLLGWAEYTGNTI